MIKRLRRFINRKDVKAVVGENYSLSPLQQERLLLIFDTDRKVKQLEGWHRTLAFFVLNDLTNYIGRLRRLREKSAAPDLYSYVLRYGKREALTRWRAAAKRKTSHFTNIPDYWTGLGHSEADAYDLALAVQKERAQKSAKLLSGTSEHSCRSLEYWLLKGLTVDQAKVELRRVCTTNGKAWYQKQGHDDPTAAQKARTESGYILSRKRHPLRFQGSRRLKRPPSRDAWLVVFQWIGLRL